MDGQGFVNRGLVTSLDIMASTCLGPIWESFQDPFVLLGKGRPPLDQSLRDILLLNTTNQDKLRRSFGSHGEIRESDIL